MAIDLSKLPAPQAIEELSFEAIVDEIKADHISRNPGVTYALELASEPLTKLIDTAAARELKLRAKYNENFRQNLLAFATGTNLDHVAANTANQRLDGESDDEFRARAQTGPNSWSVAGPERAYINLTKTASPDITDVQVVSPAAAELDIYVLVKNGGASNAILSAVTAAVNDKEKRPVADRVSVHATTRIIFNATVNLTVKSGVDTSIVIAAARAAIIKYCESERVNNGQITPSKLIGMATSIEGVVSGVSPDVQASIGGQTGKAPELGVLTINAISQ